MCQRTAKPFYHLSCCWVLFPSPPLGPVPWTHSLLTHPAASPLVPVSFPLWQMPTQPSEPSPLCPSHCWLCQHQLGVQQSSLPWLPASLPLPSAVNSPHWSFGKISVFLIYCKTKRREPKSQLLMIAAVLLTFSRAKAVLHCFTSPKDEPCFCQWTDANLLQQRICHVGLGFSVAGLIGVGGWADPWLQMNAEIARHSYVCPPHLLHLLSASFIAEAHAHTETKHVQEFSVVLCTEAHSL